MNIPNKKDDRLEELGKIYGFETDQQRSIRILNKILDGLEKEIDNDLEKEIGTAGKQ